MKITEKKQCFFTWIIINQIVEYMLFHFTFIVLLLKFFNSFSFDMQNLNKKRLKIQIQVLHIHTCVCISIYMACTQELLRGRFNLHVHLIILFHNKIKLHSSYIESYLLLSWLHSLFFLSILLKSTKHRWYVVQHPNQSKIKS